MEPIVIRFTSSAPSSRPVGDSIPTPFVKQGGRSSGECYQASTGCAKEIAARASSPASRAALAEQPLDVGELGLDGGRAPVIALAGIGRRLHLAKELTPASVRGTQARGLPDTDSSWTYDRPHRVPCSTLPDILLVILEAFA